MTRKAIPKGVRFEVFKRDGFSCVYCGATPPDVLLHIDHVVPVALNGGNGIDNLVTACQPCNLGKSDKPLSAIPKSVKEKADEAREREDQILGYQAILSEMRQRIEDDAWKVADVFNELFAPDSNSFQREWLLSIKRFVERLGLHETMIAMEIATTKKPNSSSQCFKYFCGICWTKIKEGSA